MPPHPQVIAKAPDFPPAFCFALGGARKPLLCHSPLSRPRQTRSPARQLERKMPCVRPRGPPGSDWLYLSFLTSSLAGIGTPGLVPRSSQFGLTSAPIIPPASHARPNDGPVICVDDRLVMAPPARNLERPHAGPVMSSARSHSRSCWVRLVGSIIRQFSRNLTLMTPRLVSEGEMSTVDDAMSGARLECNCVGALLTAAAGSNPTFTARGWSLCHHELTDPLKAHLASVPDEAMQRYSHTVASPLSA